MEHNAADSLTSIKGLGRKWSWESYHDEFIEAQELEKAQLTFDDLFQEAPAGACAVRRVVAMTGKSKTE